MTSYDELYTTHRGTHKLVQIASYDELYRYRGTHTLDQMTSYDEIYMKRNTNLIK